MAASTASANKATIDAAGTAMIDALLDHEVVAHQHETLSVPVGKSRSRLIDAIYKLVAAHRDDALETALAAVNGVRGVPRR